MARGAGGGDANLKLFFMKITGLTVGEKAVITQKEAIGDKKTIDLDEKLNFVKGNLHKVEIRDYEYKGEAVQELKVWLRDTLAGELYAVSCGINSIGRSIINTLLNLERPYGELEIRVYNKKDSGYAAVYLEHNGVKAGWKYSPEEQKPYVKKTVVSKKGKDVTETDTFLLDKFLIDELKANVIPHFTKVPAQFSGKEAEHSPEPALSSTGADDDLPF